MASRNISRSSSQNSTNGSSAPRRNSREAAAQYINGKKFKVKCLGREDVTDYRSGNAVAADIMKKLRQDSARLRATKPKATITLQFKGLAVFEEKSKTVSLNVPIAKVKYVCHDHQDFSVFAVIIEIDRPGDSVGYTLHCFQADQKVAVSFVRSTNELFTLIHKMMKAKRRAQAQNAQNCSSSSQSNERRGSGQPASFSIGESQADIEDKPVNLGFGIPPPPPSYKAAISKQNSEIYKIPEDMQVKPVTLPPPPKSASINRLPNRRVQPAPVVLPRPQTTPTLLSQPASSPQATIEPPGPRPVPKPRGSTRRANSEAQEASASVGSSAQPQLAMNQVETPVSTQPPQREQVRVNSVDSTGQSNEVWEEWRALEGQLQDIAQEAGIELSTNSGTMNTANAFDSQASFSTDDPFADDFFQTSFGSPTSPNPPDSLAPDQNTGAGDLFALFPSTSDSLPPAVMSEQQPLTADPFQPIGTTNAQTAPSISPPASTTDPWSTATLSSSAADPGPATTTTTTTADPFATLSSVSAETNRPVVSDTSARDPFAQTDVATSTASGFGADFDSFNSNFTSVTTSPAQVPENTFPSVQDPPQVTKIPAPSSNPRPSSRSSGARPRPKGKDSLTGTSLPLPGPFQVANSGNSTSPAAFSPETSAFSSGFDSTNFSTDNESTLQLSNPLYQSQSANNSFQSEIPTLSAFPSANTPIGSQLSGQEQPNFPLDQNWGSNNFQPQITPPQTQQQQNMYTTPVQPNFQQPQGNLFPDTQLPPQPLPQTTHMAYQFPVQDPTIAQVPVQHPQMIPQVPVQDPMIAQVPGPALVNPVMFNIPPASQEILSPLQANVFMGDGNMPDMANNPFAGDFNSPPFAVHSSTPQSPGHGGSNSYLYPTSSPLKPSQMSINEGPDPFADLLPLAISPSKATKKEEDSKTNTETPKTTRPKQPKGPSLNDLSKKQNSFQILYPETGAGNRVETSAKEQPLASDFKDAFPGGNSKSETGSAPSQSFGDDFSTTSWVAF